MAHPVLEHVRSAGVVGAGGAGFPTHVKLDARVDTVIVNGAECEPLLFKDKELMRLHAPRLVQGLKLGMLATGAGRGIIAVKAKYHDAIEAMERAAHGSGIGFYLFDNFYPAGDEYVVVADVTGRLIPPGGIPLQVGCVVSNVETFINVSIAAEGVPVTHKALTVTGAVKHPGSFVVPVGVTVRECLALAGGATVADHAVLDGGAMMGRALTDLDERVTKTTGGYIVLPRDHRVIRRKLASMDDKVKIARSACDQCMYCTEFCPRYLLGYAIEPHKVMRSVGFAGEQEEAWARLGLLCCECSLCDLYACPEDLPPKDMCIRGKGIFQKKGLKLPPLIGRGQVHPLRDARRVPVPRLIHRLGLTEYDRPAPMSDATLAPAEVRLLLKQHVGAPAVPVVDVGQPVRLGQLVAAPAEGKLGANIHASIDGRVTKVDATSIWIGR